MTTILCPTRGGERSYPNQDRAASLAKERKAELIFLYISDVTFINQVASPVLIDIEAEIDEMGEFLLAMAQERAAKQGVEAKSTVRHGVFSEVITEVIPEYKVDVLVLGSSDEEHGLTTPDYMQKMSTAIAQEHGVEVIILRDGEVLETIKG